MKTTRYLVPILRLLLISSFLGVGLFLQGCAGPVSPSVGGLRIFVHDLDGNAVPDVQMELSMSGEAEPALMKRTDSRGMVEYREASAGEWQFRIIPPEGYDVSTSQPNPIVVMVDAGEVVEVGFMLAVSTREYEGLVGFGFEASSFLPCQSTERWWVTAVGEPNAKGELADRYDELKAAGAERVYARVLGKRSPPGQYGHLGSYEREIVVEEVLEVREAGAEECR